MPTDSVERRWGLALHILGCIAALTVVVAVAAPLFLPLQARASALHAATEDAWKLLSESEKISDAHRDAKRELEAAETRIRRVQQQIPERAEEGDFKTQFAGLAAECEFELEDYRPGASEPHRFCQQIRIHVRGRGSYEATVRLLAGLDALPRLCRATDVTIVAADEPDDFVVEMALTIFYASRPESIGVLSERKNG
ncbi:MAG: type 4a pilus biogenesis protein PilO [Planctomycetaceae bacterium]|nr:type 4a pilus biogenesis protein PilO [Planctomycetaceae bacterium]